MSDREFYAYVGLLALCGLTMAVLAVRGFDQSRFTRVLDFLTAAACLGCGGYLFMTGPGTAPTRPAWAAFTLPVLLTLHMFRQRRRARARRLAAGLTPRAYAEQPPPTPLTPFPAPPPPLGSTAAGDHPTTAGTGPNPGPGAGLGLSNLPPPTLPPSPPDPPGPRPPMPSGLPSAPLAGGPPPKPPGRHGMEPSPAAATDRPAPPPGRPGFSALGNIFNAPAAEDLADTHVAFVPGTQPPAGDPSWSGGSPVPGWQQPAAERPEDPYRPGSAWGQQPGDSPAPGGWQSAPTPPSGTGWQQTPTTRHEADEYPNPGPGYAPGAGRQQRPDAGAADLSRGQPPHAASPQLPEGGDARPGRHEGFGTHQGAESRGPGRHSGEHPQVAPAAGGDRQSLPPPADQSWPPPQGDQSWATQPPTQEGWASRPPAGHEGWAAPPPASPDGWEQWPGETGQAGGHWAASGRPEGHGEADGTSGGDTGQYGMNEPYGYAPDPRYSTYHPQERFPGHGEPYAGGGRHAGHGYRYEEPPAGHDTHAAGDTHAEQAQVWETSSRLRQPAWLSSYPGEPEAVAEPADDEADESEETGRHGGGGRAPRREDRPPRHG